MKKKTMIMMKSILRIMASKRGGKKGPRQSQRRVKMVISHSSDHGLKKRGKKR